MNFPENLKYTKTHEWISVNGNTAKVGITEYAQKEISDVVFVELPKVGFAAQKEKGAAVVESKKLILMSGALDMRGVIFSAHQCRKFGNIREFELKKPAHAI